MTGLIGQADRNDTCERAISGTDSGAQRTGASLGSLSWHAVGNSPASVGTDPVDTRPGCVEASTRAVARLE